MSKTFHHGERRNWQRQIRVRGIRREPADLRKLARALIALAQAQAEVDAKVEHNPRENTDQPSHKNAPSDTESTDTQGDAA